MTGLRDKIMTAGFDPAERPEVETAATAIAGTERDLRSALQDHYEALGLEAPPDLPPVEDRVEQFKTLVRYHTSGDLWGYFCEEQAPEDLENLEQARKHAGKGPEEWEQTLETWAANLREQLGETAEDVPDRDLAERYCEAQFGVGLEAFEMLVVRWSEARTMRTATRGRIDEDIRGLQSLTAALEAGEVDVDEEALPDDVDGESSEGDDGD